jgi:type IV pilus assembly protein PilX
MKSPSNIKLHPSGSAARQRGVVLFFALIALVVMSLAAVALIRSVDTSTMIAGNLAFKQSATTSGDSGVEAAINALNATQTAMQAIPSNVLMDPANALNVTNAANGYYSNADPAMSLTDPANWVDAKSMLVTSDDGAGNEVRYIIQRMCRNPNVVVSKTNCLFSAAALDNNGQQVPLPSDVCQGSGCPSAGQSPQYRITSRIAGPANTVSYIQAFVY